MHYRARSYDPRLGRLVQKDPHDRIVDQYVCARNNPVRATDPSGMISEEEAQWLRDQVRVWSKIDWVLSILYQRLLDSEQTKYELAREKKDTNE